MLLFSTSYIVSTSRLEKRIEKNIAPYQAALQFMNDLDPAKEINDHDVFVFFNHSKLYKKQDERKLKNTIQILKNIRHSKKLSSTAATELTTTINSLEKIILFIRNYAGTYAALMSGII